MPELKALEQGSSFDLVAMSDELRRESAYEQTGHTARTLVRTPDLRVVLVALQANARMAEHQVEQTASIQVLRGTVRLTLPERTVELRTGELLVMEAGLSHDVDATEESAFLLTLGWDGTA